MITVGDTLVSVIVPVYNMESLLGQTLDSILASSYRDMEVIVMDDGSTDASLSVAQSYAERDDRLRVYSQQNQGVIAARNNAISKAAGFYILPVDADNTIEPDFIDVAVKMMAADPEIKVVAPRADFFGERTGEWKLPAFSLSLLARKNIMDTCALYRKADWERVGGYCKEIIAREDWEFWISVLKDGGRVVRTSKTMLHYRVRNGSKRTTDRQLKRHVVDVLNKRHPEFFERELYGRLHYHRTWSRCLNLVYRFFHPRKVRVDDCFAELKDCIKVLPEYFRTDKGRLIYRGRNELREWEEKGYCLVVKSFAVPHLLNRLVYGILRTSKAQRSYEYAKLLLSEGIGTPVPVGFYTERSGLLFRRSYYVSLRSGCPYTYAEMAGGSVPVSDDVLRAIARTTARLHEKGFLHKDYSRGNILFGRSEDGQVRVEIVDLNRIRFQKIDMECGCRNFERLPGPPEWFRTMADEYAAVRGFDADECFRLIMKYNKGH